MVDYFHDTIEGMNPVSPPHFSMDENEHTSYCAYELTSGAIIYNAKKVQFSFMIKQDERIEYVILFETEQKCEICFLKDVQGDKRP